MTSTATMHVGAVFAERYEIVGRLGAGASSVVYEARMRPMMRRVALKLLRTEVAARPDAAERFLRAGRQLGELDHPHVVTMVDVGVGDGVPFLAVEFLDGETLAAKLLRDRFVPAAGALALLLPIVSAVASMHERGIVHGDLKPSSIMLARQATGHLAPKLLDLGLASIGGRPGEAGGLEPQYQAPEAASGAACVDARCDQWSMAVILWETLVGRALFPGPRPADIIGAVTRAPIPPLAQLVAGVDPRLDVCLARALQRDPSRRFPSVAAFARSLLPCMDDADRARWASVFGTPRAGEAPGPAVPAAHDLAPRYSQPAAPPLGEPAPSVERTMVSVEATMVAHDSGPLRPSLPSAAPAALRGGGSSRPGWVVPAAAVVVLAMAVGGAVAVMSGDGESERAPRVAGSANTYPVALRTEPLHAHIDLDGEYVSAGVLLREFPRDGRSHTLRVYAPGYEPQMLTFANVGPGELVTLAPLGARVSAPPGSGPGVEPGQAGGGGTVGRVR